jgi:DNA helicase II / ATP-dependent DNA helicase PcrA
MNDIATQFSRATGSIMPEYKIDEFDLKRQYYVAFSRAAKLLVLTGVNNCNYHINSIWNSLDQWPHLTTNLLSKQKFDAKESFIPKRSYGLTSHINMFEICPRKYQFHVEHEFSQSSLASSTPISFSPR